MLGAKALVATQVEVPSKAEAEAEVETEVPSKAEAEEGAALLEEVREAVDEAAAADSTRTNTS